VSTFHLTRVKGLNYPTKKSVKKRDEEIQVILDSKIAEGWTLVQIVPEFNFWSFNTDTVFYFSK
jgi:hypothetical protein